MKKIIKTNDTKNRVYGVIGMVALFLMGAIFGYIINGSDRVNHSMMSERQCTELQDQIMNMVRNVHAYDAQKIAQLDKMFSENCNNRDFGKNTVQPKPQPKPVEEEKLPDTTCEAIEKLLKDELYDESAPDWEAHRDNSDVYNRLAENGCEKNKEMYQKMAQREIEIAKALNKYDEPFDVDVTDNDARSTCEEIEHVLTMQLQCRGKNETCFDVDDHVRNAQIYANLSERGCAENSTKYKDLAAKELEIARALTDDNIEQNKHEATEMVETYKRLHMQQEAARMLEKAKKLTNPAIDFIIELEKIIEE